LEQNGKNLTYKLFAYGSLKSGHRNHDILDNSDYLGEYHAPKGYRLVVNGLPYLLEDHDGEGCYGELYEVKPRVLINCDALEGHPEWYKRTLITVINVETKMKEKAYAYIYQGKVDGTVTRRY